MRFVNKAEVLPLIEKGAVIHWSWGAPTLIILGTFSEKIRNSLLTTLYASGSVVECKRDHFNVWYCKPNASSCVDESKKADRK